MSLSDLSVEATMGTSLSLRSAPSLLARLDGWLMARQDLRCAKGKHRLRIEYDSASAEPVLRAGYLAKLPMHCTHCGARHVEHVFV